MGLGERVSKMIPLEIYVPYSYTTSMRTICLFCTNWAQYALVPGRQRDEDAFFVTIGETLYSIYDAIAQAASSDRSIVCLSAALCVVTKRCTIALFVYGSRIGIWCRHFDFALI